MIKTLQKMLINSLAPVIVIALFIGALLLFQNRLLYFPSTAELHNYAPPGMTLWPANKEGQAHTSALNSELNSEFTTGLGLLALPPEDVVIRGTVIVYHGNAGHAGHREYYAHTLNPLGLRVILAEYPGYGPRPGQPNEINLVNDAVGIAILAHERYAEPLWIFGESLGAGVAAAVTARVPELVQGVVLITPWNRLVDVAEHHYPFLPVKWLLQSDYDSIKALLAFNKPKLLITAELDTIVPAELGQDLYQKTQQPKRLIEIEGVGHNNWISSVPVNFWEDVLLWLEDS